MIQEVVHLPVRGRRLFLKSAALGGAGFLLGAGPRLLGAMGEAEADPATLYIAAAKTARTLDPAAFQGYLMWEDFEANVNLYDRLLINRTAPNSRGVGEVVFEQYLGGLAESWSVGPDRRTWTFRLREGVRSFRGNEMTAADVKWGWDRSFALKDSGYSTATKWMLVESNDAVRVAGRYAVQMQTWRENPEFLMSLFALPAVFDTAEVKKHVSADDLWGRRWLAENDAGFGAYHVDTFKPGREIVFVANDRYFGGAPAARRVVYREMPSPVDRLQALLGGEVDVAEWLTPKQRAILGRLGEASGARVLSARGSNYILLGLNPNLKPFDDVRVRRAAAFVLPYEEILAKVYYGAARRWRGFTPDIYPGYPDHRAYETDPAQARQLLSEAGLERGFRTTLHYSSRYEEEAEASAQLIRDALGRINIDVLLRKVTADGMFELRFLTKNYQMYLFLNANFMPGPREQQNLYWGTASRYGAGEREQLISSERRQRPDNYSGVFDPDLLRLLDQSENEMDLARRMKIYEQIQTIALDRAYMLPLASVGIHLGVRRPVSGWKVYAEQHIRFADLQKSG